MFNVNFAENSAYLTHLVNNTLKSVAYAVAAINGDFDDESESVSCALGTAKDMLCLLGHYLDIVTEESDERLYGVEVEHVILDGKLLWSYDGQDCFSIMDEFAELFPDPYQDEEDGVNDPWYLDYDVAYAIQQS